MGTKEKIAKNTLFNGAASVFSLAVYFFLMPFIIGKLGLTQFGVYVLLSSLISYFALLEFGTSASLVKHVAEYHTQRDRQRLQEVVSATFFLYLGMGLISAIGIAAFGYFFLPQFNIPDSLLADGRKVVYVMAALSLVTWPMTTFSHTLAGLQRYDLMSIIGITGTVTTGAATMILLTRGYGLVELIAVEGLVALSGLFVLAIIVARDLGYQPIRFRYAKLDIFKGLIGFSLLVFVVQLSQQISYRSDTLVLGLFLPVGSLALYEAANKIQRLCDKAFTIADSAVLPAASELDAAGENRTLAKLYLRGSAYTAAATLSVALPMIFMAKWLLVFWLGKEFGEVALAAQVFVSFWFFTALAGLTRTVLVGAGRVRLLAAIVTIRSILNLILSLVLVRRFGILGVILGTVLSEIVFYPVIVKYTLATLGIRWRQYLEGVVVKTAKPALIAAGLIYVALLLRQPAGLFEVAVYSLATAATFLLSFYWLSLEPAEKADVRLLVRLDTFRLVRRRAA